MEAEMSTEGVTFETMHAEHTSWLAAHANWRRDIERWRAEQNAAAARLNTMQRLIEEDGEDIEEHAWALRQVEDAIAGHDREIARYLTGTSEPPQDLTTNRHYDEESTFSKQQDAHEQIKKHHEELMVQLQRLETEAAN
jgi:hypothetical protein